MGTAELHEIITKMRQVLKMELFFFSFWLLFAHFSHLLPTASGNHQSIL